MAKSKPDHIPLDNLLTGVEKRREEFVPTFELIIAERNGIGDVYPNVNGDICQKCGIQHKVRMKHYVSTSGSGLAGMFDWHRRKNPIPKRNRNNES